MRYPLFVASVAALLTVVACTGPKGLPPLPEGLQTLSGTVIPTVISATQRGTHALAHGTEKMVYLRSATVNLREYHGRSVALQGHLEHNIDPEDLPVLVVENVIQAEEATRPWVSESLGITGDVPIRWGVSGSGALVEFIAAGSLRPIVAISLHDSAPLPSGIALNIGGARAIRFLDEISGEQRIAVARGKGYLELAFTPQGQDSIEQARAEWLAFLRSLKISGAHAVSSVRTGSTGGSSSRLEGAPCGGLAGILCPSGQYCEITDLENNIGVCRKIE